MSCSVTVKYDKALVRKALNRYMLRRLGKSFFIAVAAALFVFLFAFLGGAWSWLLTVLGLVLLAAFAFLVFVYFARLRAAEGFFDEANDPVVKFHFTAEGVRTESDIGSTDLKWPVFEEILKFPEVWLLVYARSGYMTLPTDQLSAECRQFIEKQIPRSRP